MKQWMEEAAERQRRWSEEFKQLIVAGRRLIEQLEKEIQVDLFEYKRHFPSGQVTVQQIKNGLRIVQHTSAPAFMQTFTSIPSENCSGITLHHRKR